MKTPNNDRTKQPKKLTSEEFESFQKRWYKENQLNKEICDFAHKVVQSLTPISLSKAIQIYEKFAEIQKLTK